MKEIQEIRDKLCKEVDIKEFKDIKEAYINGVLDMYNEVIKLIEVPKDEGNQSKEDTKDSAECHPETESKRT